MDRTTLPDPQRIHPLDLESSVASKPTAPLVPPTTARSDHFSPPAPPPRRSIPLSQTRPPKTRRNSLCRCLCFSLLTLITLIVAIAAALGILYLIFRPKLPTYSVDRLRITAFSIDPNFTARAGFDLSITANNPNKRIGIYYLDGSSLRVSYRDTILCWGSFPVFYQGHRNRTRVDVAVEGEAELGGEVVSGLREAEGSGSVPLRFAADVPVKVKVGGLKLWKVKARVRCDLVVGRLSVGSFVSLKTSNCKFRLKL